MKRERDIEREKRKIDREIQGLKERDKERERWERKGCLCNMIKRNEYLYEIQDY